MRLWEGCCRGDRETTERQRGQPPVTSQASARSHAGGGAKVTDIDRDKAFVYIDVCQVKTLNIHFMIMHRIAVSENIKKVIPLLSPNIFISI